MNLQEFISEALGQIIFSVNKINGDFPDALVTLHSMGDNRTVEFDVAISSEEKSDMNGGAGLKVLSFNASANAEKTYSNASVSRVRFGVDVSNRLK